MCNVIIQNDLQDQHFIDYWCYGYDEFKENVAKYTPEFAAETCGVDADLIVEAACALGRAKNACLQWGVAMDHTSEGFITGMASKMFVVAGPVIVFGTLASVVYGVILMLMG